MIRKCKNCEEEFEARKSEVKRKRGKFCGLSCSAIYGNKHREKPEPNVTCAYCNNNFYKINSRLNISKSGLHFCSRKCKDTAQRLGGIKEIQPSHYGTGKTHYREKVRRELGINKCSKCGYDEHSEILEVHHKDRNKNNNKLDNLEVLCPNCHMWEHYQNKDGRYGIRKETKIRQNEK